jgi:deazaflavin-dependent oxidoreductase (nitroreductase family)
MAQDRYSTFHVAMQRLASSRPGAWFLSRTQHHFDRVLLKLTNNRATLTSIVAGLPVVMLTCTGAKSGLPRTVPLACIRDVSEPDRFAFIASNWGQRHHPAWYHNLKANPRATCSIAGQAGDYIAHEAEGVEYDRFWQAATNTYIGFPLYRQRAGDRHIPIMVMTPVSF